MTAHIITFPSTAIRDRDGTDWVSIAEVVTAIMHQLMGASSSRTPPTNSRSRQADANAAAYLQPSRNAHSNERNS